MYRSDLHISDYIRSIAGVITFFTVFLVATPVILLMLLISLGQLTNAVVERVAPLMMKPVLGVLRIRFRIVQHGKPVDRPAVYIINHSSTVDMLTILALGLPRIRFVAKWEFQYNPIFLLLGRLTGQIFIKRKRSEEAIQTLQKTYRRVKKQQLSVMLAPEGSRKHPGIIGPFKKGPFHMAMDLDYPIVPIYFEGNRELSAGGSMLTKPGTVTAHIHEPVDVSGWTPATLEDHIRDVRRRYLEWAGVVDDPVEPISQSRKKSTF